MKNSKRIISIILSFLIVFSAVVGLKTMDVYAEDVSITLAIWPTEVGVGDSLTATITISGENLGEYDIFLEYPTDILKYNDDNTGIIEIAGKGTNTVSYTFTATAEGTGKIQTSGYKLYDANGSQLSVVHAGGNVTIGEVQSEDNTIKIGNDYYTLVDDHSLPAHPEGYELSYVTINGKDIYAYQAPNQKIKVVCLQNADWEQKWFVYDEETKEFSPYIEYSLEGVKYVILNKPEDVEIEDRFEETNLTLDGCQVTAYSDGSDSGLYLVYALNSTGGAGLYYYDTNEGNLTRYEAVKSIIDASVANTATETEAYEETTTEEKSYATPLIPTEKKSDTEEEEGLLSRDTLKNLLIMMIILFVVMCVVVIVLVIKNGILQNQLYGDEDDEDYEDEEDVVNRAKKDAKDKAEAEEKAEEKDPNRKTGKNNTYAVNEDTGEILIEEAADNNAGINVPPVEDDAPSKIEQAMKERPYGMDSAFDVVAADEAPEGEHVYHEPEPQENLIDPAQFDRELEKKAFINLDDDEDNEPVKNVEEPEDAEEVEGSDSTEDTDKSDEPEEKEEKSEVIGDTVEFAKKSKKKNRKKNKKKNQSKKDEKPQKVALPSEDDEEED